MPAKTAKAAKPAKPAIAAVSRTANDVLAELQALGSEQTKKTLLRHGAKEPLFGVKIGDMKPLAKQIGKNHPLAMELYDTGNYDAMYFAAMLAVPAQMSKSDLNRWAEQAKSQTLCGSIVPAMAAESPHGFDLAAAWIDSPKEGIAVAGWTAYTMLVSMKPDDEMDLKRIEGLLRRVKAEIERAPNHVRYAMNMFVIAVGGGIASLTDRAKATARSIGKVKVDMGDTACQVPDACEYIAKIEKMGRIGKKRKTAMC